MTTFTGTEHFNISVLERVIDLPFIRQEDKPSLLAYLKLAKQSAPNGIKVSYAQNTYNGVAYGRLYPNIKVAGIRPMTAQGQWRHIRTVLFADTETDIDIVNCHPTLLQELCRAHGVKSTLLDSYVRDRDQFINTQMTISDEDVKRFNQMESSALSKKDLGKLIVSATIFGCKDYARHHLKTSPYKNQFPAEIARISKTITSLPMYEQLVNDIKISKSDSHQGSWLSFILQEEELRYVMTAVEAFQEQEIEVTCLIHDGFQIKSKDNQVIDSILHQINTNAGVVRFIRKPFASSVFDLNIATPNSNEDSEYSQSFLDAVDKFEQTHAKVMAKSKFLVVTGDGYDLKTRTDILSTYEHMYYINKDKKKTPFIRDWLKYEFQKCYIDIGIYPPGIDCPEGWFNAWRPFSAELMSSSGANTTEELAMILNHIKVLCNHEEPVYEYFISWIGHMLKYPAVKSKCITLISKQGAGKGTLIDMLKRLIGQFRVLSTSKPSREVWGMFNGQMENAFLVNLDELSKKETVDSLGEIKKLITDDTLTISRKGVGQYDIRSFHRFIVTTNNEDPIRSDADDRRNLIIRSSDEFCPCVMGAEASGEYFTRLRKAMAKDDVIVALYKYFVEIPDLDKFNSKPIPTTEQQEALKEMSRSDIEMWLDYFVQVTEGESHKMMSSDAYESYKVWCTINKKECYYNNIQFAVRLRLLRIPGVETGIKTKAGSAIKLDLVQLKGHFGMIDGLVLDECF